MAKIGVEFSASAIEDLESIRRWYEDQHAAEVGRRLVAEVFERAESLPLNPELGRVVPEFDQPWLRELIHPPFRIVYKREPDNVRIVRVWRSERRLNLPDSE